MDYIKKSISFIQNKVKNTYLTYSFMTYNSFITDYAIMLELLFSIDFPKEYTKYDKQDFHKAIQNSLMLYRYCHAHGTKLQINIPALFIMNINNDNDCKMYLDLFN